jgi:paraquat-inducible protein A
MTAQDQPYAPVFTDGAALGLIACRACGHTVRRTPDTRCDRCGARIRPPRPRDLQTVWALLAAGMIAYIPANLLPMLETSSFGGSRADTIVGGAVDLAAHGAYFVAAVILTASVAIPIGKFLAIGWLAVTIARGTSGSLTARRRLHTLVEFIGRWSMIDVFVVAILAALVQLGFLASIRPGPAAAPFAASVVLTMLAAQALDPRLIWARIEGDRA